MSSILAIFIKQTQDTLKNMGVLVQFIVFPVMAFIMTRFVDVGVGDMSDAFFIIIFASMFIGMTLISSSAVAIAEDREKKSLRFLMMAGVKSHHYLMGVGGVFLVFALVVGSAFVVMMGEISFIERLIMLTSMMLGAIASILFGGIIGMITKNEQSAVSLSTAAGMIMGFGPMIGMFNENIEKIFSIFYTSNFIYADFSTEGIIGHMIVILGNILVLALLFGWVYKKRGLRT